MLAPRLAAIALALSACSTASEPAAAPAGSANSAPTTSATTAAIPAAPKPAPTARQRVTAGAALLDVRTPQEFAAGHLEGAINIPVDELQTRLAEVPRGREVVVYCRSGRRSANATSLLRGAGWEVFDLGPMTAW